MPITSLAEAELALRPFVPLVAQLTGGGTTLERIEPLMELLGSPQNRLRVVHVAGTSGKTSTCYYIAAMLSAAGKRVGLTVSPHVDSITERVQIDGVPLSVSKFCEDLDVFLDLVSQAVLQPSYFELLYAFALWEFERQGVDYAVIETGLGGLYDATNVASRADKVCVITDIGYDHQHILGNTLPLIAAQKIGIVHSGNVAICYQQAPEIMGVFTDYVTQVGGQMFVTSQIAEERDYRHILERLPLFQRRNWLLSRRAYLYLAERDGLANLTNSEWYKTQQLQVPGRMEIIHINGMTMVMDGAHNEQKMAAFIESFEERFKGVKPAVLIALKKGKEYSRVCPLFANFASTVIVTTFDTSQDLPAVSMDAHVLAAELTAVGLTNVLIETDAAKAYHTLMQLPQKVCVITGSFYLLSQIRKGLL